MESLGFHELILRAQSGDAESLDRLLTHVRPFLEGVAREFADPDNATESTSDIVQESWVRAWSGLERFAGGADDEEAAARFRAWSAQIVRNYGIEAKRKRQRKKRSAPLGKVRRLDAAPDGSRAGSLEPAAIQSTPSARLRGVERSDQIRNALASLGDETVREVVRLRFFESLSMRDIAERLGLTYDQVRERFHRGMRELTQSIKRLG